MFANLFKLSGLKSEDQKRTEAYSRAIREEAKVGGRLFGSVPEGTYREFFCLDTYTWIWHEEWTDEKGKRQIRTTRYDVRPNGVYKAQDGQPYRPVTEAEAYNLLMATKKYGAAIDAELAPILAANGM
jgi:hypothetical protein